MEPDERTHYKYELHAGARARGEGPDERKSPEAFLATQEQRLEEAFIEQAEYTWARVGTGGRAAIERLEEAALARDVEGLTEALEGRTGCEPLSAAWCIAQLEERDHRMLTQALAGRLRDAVRDDTLAVMPESAEALEATAKGWMRYGRLDEGRIIGPTGGATWAASAFTPRRWTALSPLAEARVDAEAIGRLGYWGDEIPSDAAGRDAVREALRREDPDLRALVREAPLHVRLKEAKGDGHRVADALILEQACAGPCLDAPYRGTLARVRGAMVGALDRQRRAREDYVRTILSAARDTVDPPGVHRTGVVPLEPTRLGDALEGTVGVSAAFVSVVRAASKAAAEPEIGRVWALGIEAAKGTVRDDTERALDAALKSARAAQERDRSRWDAGPVGERARA